MALDRQSIEKRDFPISRRGYDVDAVDDHLGRIAEELSRLQGELQAARAGAAEQPRHGAASLAAAASEQVRAIVEAAESTAEQIERQARDEADRIRQDAQGDAERIRSEAVQRSEEHVGRVGEATRVMLQRVDAMESELDALVESLRTGANRLNADLSLLQGNMGELYDAAGGGSRDAAPVAPAAPPTPTPAPAVEPEVSGDIEPLGVEVVEPPTEQQDAAPVPPARPAERPPAPRAAAPDDDADAEGARLVALNMALNGQSREETDRYLAENFDLADRQALLDEVYATVET